jgi:multidrug efflux pump subunit AcrA (membrane-fusion protein)
MSIGQHRQQRPSQQRLRRFLAQLGQERLSPAAFYHDLLRRVVSTLGAVGGAVWRRSDEGQLELAGEVNLQATGLLDDEAYKARHGRLLERVMATGRSAIINQREEAGPTDSAAPKELLLVFGPLKGGLTGSEQTEGLVEIFQCPTGEAEQQKHLLRAVLEACEAAAEYHSSTRHSERSEESPSGRAARVGEETLRSAQGDSLAQDDSGAQSGGSAHAERDALFAQLETFARAVHTGLNPREAAYTVANEGRRLIGCDRVSVAVLRGERARIEAVSGQDYFDPRANSVRLLAKLASLVAATREPLWFDGDARNLPPQVERTVLKYVDESQTKMVAVLPLTRRPPDDEPRRRREKPIGALIVEQIEDTTPQAGFAERVETVRQHAGMALGNALEYHSLFLLPLWRFLGRLGLVVKFRTLPKTIIVAGLIAAAAGALIVVPGNFDLEGRGTLQPATRQEVFARIDGQIVAVNVKHLDTVAAGAVLATMRSTDLDAKITELEGQIQARQSELQSIETLRVSERRNMTPAEEKQLTGRKQEIEVTIRSLQEQLKLHRGKRADLVIRAPLAGAVTTLDVRDRLIGRPVTRGDALLSVANLDGQWELEVRMPEDRMGHILQARQELLRRRREHPGENLPEDLPVKFILATDPGVTFEGVVKEIHHRAEVRGEDGNTVLIKVAIDKSELPQLRPGASVVAKLHCGRRGIGYVWFHDLIEFVQAKILFRL